MGFFDYSTVDPHICSYRCEAHEHESSRPYDRVYSVSVLAHMSGLERQKTVERVSEWLRPGGRLLLASTCCRRATSSGTARRETRSSPRPSTAPSRPPRIDRA